MKEYLKLLRIKHYIKNLLIFLPLFFAGQIFNLYQIKNGLLGFVAFSLVSSAVYILNDIQDIDKDRNHPTKRMRPLASGKIKPICGVALMVVCLFIAIVISLLFKQTIAWILLGVYFLLNVLYSLGLKNIPIVDIVILAAGFVIRLIYGGVITNIAISKWLYLVVVTGSLYMGIGKRRNELNKQKNTREVLKYYTLSFLDKNMYVCVSLTNIFYALWAMELQNPLMIWTVPFFIVLLMRYSLDVEAESDGDPTEVILHDKVLIGMILTYAVLIFLMLYLFGK